MLTTEQLSILRAACFSDAPAAALISAGDANGLHAYLNGASSFIVWRSSVETREVGNAVSYVAVEAMTDANRGRINTFYGMNPDSFDPSRADVRTYWSNTFSGALGGQGQATRDALDALWRRAALNAERLLATGTGTTVAPGVLSFEGEVTPTEATRIVYRDDGTIWTQG